MFCSFKYIHSSKQRWNSTSKSDLAFGSWILSQQEIETITGVLRWGWLIGGHWFAKAQWFQGHPCSHLHPETNSSPFCPLIPQFLQLSALSHNVTEGIIYTFSKVGDRMTYAHHWVAVTDPKPFPERKGMVQKVITAGKKKIREKPEKMADRCCGLFRSDSSPCCTVMGSLCEHATRNGHQFETDTTISDLTVWGS